MSKKTFYIETLGCKVNHYESDGIASELESRGLKRGKKKENADVCIINTCSVTSKAGMQSRQAIRKLIRNNPDAKILVTGCHAQTDPELAKQIPEIDHIVCHRDKTQITQCLAPCKSEPEKNQFEFKKADHTNSNQFIGFDEPVSGSMTRAYLKIQDGCNQFCTYCIVPYARGASVSMPQNDVIRHMDGLAQKGFREVIITGIHTGMYGLDFSPPTSLAEMVKLMDEKKQVDRIRISSIEPNEISPELIDMAKPGHILCDHFHIPLQSGDDAVLEKMKRPYTVEEFTSVIHSIHKDLPFAGIGLDIIMGFPGETDEAFENTYKLVESLPVSYLHVFPFSPRKGTPAFHFTPKVPSQLTKERCAIMRELGQKKQAAFIRSNKGRKLQALIQHQVDKDTGLLKAVTSNYLTVLVKDTSNQSPKAKEGLKGKMVDLIYKQCDSDLNIIGSIVC